MTSILNFAEVRSLDVTWWPDMVWNFNICRKYVWKDAQKPRRCFFLFCFCRRCFKYLQTPQAGRDPNTIPGQARVNCMRFAWVPTIVRDITHDILWTNIVLKSRFRAYVSFTLTRDTLQRREVSSEQKRSKLTGCPTARFHSFNPCHVGGGWGGHWTLLTHVFAYTWAFYFSTSKLFCNLKLQVISGQVTRSPWVITSWKVAIDTSLHGAIILSS